MRAVTSATTGFMWVISCCSRARRDGRARRWAVTLRGRSVVPLAAVALDESGRGAGTTGACWVEPGGVLRAGPALVDRLDPRPRGLDLVATHEQRRVAAHDVHEQPLVGVGRAALEGLGVAEVQRDRPQPDATGAGLLGDHVQP